MALTAMLRRKDNNIIFGWVSCNQNKRNITKHVNFMLVDILFAAFTMKNEETPPDLIGVSRSFQRFST